MPKDTFESSTEFNPIRSYPNGNSNEDVTYYLCFLHFLQHLSPLLLVLFEDGTFEVDYNNLQFNEDFEYLADEVIKELRLSELLGY